MSVSVLRNVAIICDRCGDAGPAANTAAEARFLAREEGWRVDRRRAKPDECDCCQAPS